MNHFSLKNKIAVITGGCSGIGLGVAKRFKDYGAKVVVVDIKIPEGFEQKEDLVAFSTNVGDESSMISVFQKIKLQFDHIDILINNAGIGDLPGTIIEGDSGRWRRIFDINVFGVFYGIKYGAPILKKGGVIINTASQAAITKIGGMEPYSASKAAVVSITQTAALELAERQIRVNAVCPSNTKTPMMSNSADVEISEKLSQVFSPSGRAAELVDMIGLFHFLVSDAARYINGQAIVADGGWTAGVSNATLKAIL